MISGCLVGFIFHIGNGVIYQCPPSSQIPSSQTLSSQTSSSQTSRHAYEDMFKLGVATFAVQVALPLLLVTIVQLLTYKQQRNKLKDCPLQASGDGVRECAETSGHFNRLSLIVSAVFFVCVVPINIFYFLVVMKLARPGHSDVRTVYDILLLLEVVRLLVNPLIFYTMYRSPVRKEMGSQSVLVRTQPEEKSDDGNGPKDSLVAVTGGVGGTNA